MDLNDLPNLVKQLQDRSSEQAALKTLLSELGQAMADLLSHSEQSGPALAKAMADALKGVRMEAPKVEVKPTINVQPATVNPTPVQVHVEAPAVQVHVPKQPAPKQAARIKFNWLGDQLESAEVTYR